MAHDGVFPAAPINLHQSEPIPAEAMAEIAALLTSGDLFRYTTPDQARCRSWKPSSRR